MPAHSIPFAWCTLFFLHFCFRLHLPEIVLHHNGPPEFIHDVHVWRLLPKGIFTQEKRLIYEIHLEYNKIINALCFYINLLCFFFQFFFLLFYFVFIQKLYYIW